MAAHPLHPFFAPDAQHIVFAAQCFRKGFVCLTPLLLWPSARFLPKREHTFLYACKGVAMQIVPACRVMNGKRQVDEGQERMRKTVLGADRL